MPQTHSTASATGLPPVPVAVLLPPAQGRRDTIADDGDASGWCGIQPRDVAGLIARYTRPGDVVVTLDADPVVTRAARYLGRRPATLPTDRDHRAGTSRRAPRIVRHPGAGLILARLPGGDADHLDLHAVTAAMHTWRRLLRPGGYLLTALTPPRPDDGRSSLRSTVIVAARTAGLTWQQEFLVPLAPLPEYEPRAMPEAAATTPAALVDGRHEPVHIKLLAFHHRTGGTRA